MMDQILRPHQAYAAAYIDDIIIHSDSWDVHIRQLRAVLEELRRAGLTANPNKCRLGLEETCPHPSPGALYYLDEAPPRDAPWRRLVAGGGTRHPPLRLSRPVTASGRHKMYRPELWPEGSVVLRYYEPRNVKGPGKAAPASDTTPGGASVTLS